MKRDEIARLLPAIFQRTVRDDNPLGILLEVMEQLHAPAEAAVAELAHYFDPYRAPDAFVAFMATWVDLTMLLRSLPNDFALREDSLATGMGRLRELVAASAHLSQWRGTRKGLLNFLEIATNVQGFQIDEAVTFEGKELPFHIQITAPKVSEAQRSLLVQIIEMEKPAYVTYDLLFAES